MKKTKMIAALFAASALSACAADVYSSNIVGYSKLTLVPGLTLVGNPFQSVGSTDASKSIQELVQSSGLADWEDTFTFFDPLTQMWSVTYYYTDEEGVVDSETGETADYNVSVGAGFFVTTSSTTAEVILSGEVPDAEIGQNVPFGAGLTLMSNPYPYALKLNEHVATTGMLDWEDTFILFDPVEQMWSYTYYYTDDDGIVDSETGETASDLAIPVGGAFFIMHSGSGGTISFAAPGVE